MSVLVIFPLTSLRACAQCVRGRKKRAQLCKGHAFEARRLALRGFYELHPYSTGHCIFFSVQNLCATFLAVSVSSLKSSHLYIDVKNESCIMRFSFS